MVAPLDTPMVCPVIVGRMPQIDALQRALAGLRRGEGRAVLIAGEAGIGKSRLVREAQRQAEELGIRTLVGQCFESDRSLPFAPIVDLVRAFCLANSPDAIAEYLAPVGSALLRVLPDLEAWLPDVTSPPPLDPEQERRRVFTAITKLTARLAAAQPLLLVFEDLHWSDDTSLELLPQLARSIMHQPIGLLLTYRSDEVSPKLAHTLAELDRTRLAVEISLTPFNEAEIDLMLQAIFGLARVPRSGFRNAISNLTGGNPFFIEEVLRSLVTQGDLYLREGSWSEKALTALRIPRSVQDAVKRRQEELSRPAVGVLEIASVIGQRFEFDLLPPLAGLEDETVLGCVKELVAAQLVVEHSAEQFAFRHALTRQAVYGGLLARERMGLHRRVAEAIESATVDASEANLPELAYHYYEGGVWEKALDCSRRVGERALRLHSPQAAVEHLTRALEAASHLPGTPQPTLHRARGGAYEALGEWDAALADYEAALRLATEAGIQRGVWEALLDLGMLWAGRDYDRTQDYYRQALNLAQAIGDQTLVAHSLNRVGNWHVNVEEPHQAVRYHQQALAIFEQEHDEAGVAATLDFLGMASSLSSDLIDAAATYRRAVTLLRAVDDRAALCSSLATSTLRGISPQTSSMVAPPGTLADCIRDGEEALAIARAIEHRSAETFALSMLAFTLTGTGEYGRALALGEEARRIAEEIGHLQWTTCAECVLGSLALDMLDTARARGHLERALAMANEVKSGHWRHLASGCLASACIEAHDLERATAVLESLKDLESPAATLGLRIVWCARIELALARHEPDQAWRLLEQVAAATPNLDAFPRRAPRLSMLRASVLTMRGRLDEANDELAAAREIAIEQGARPLIWRIELAHAGILTAQGLQAEASQATALARATISALADEIPDATERAAYLARAGALLPLGAVPRPRRAPAQSVGGLTARERDVALLVAKGKSNRDIAAELYVGERTVETHISNILAKLSAENRTQIAAWAATHDLG